MIEKDIHLTESISQTCFRKGSDSLMNQVIGIGKQEFSVLRENNSFYVDLREYQKSQSFLI